MIFKGTEKLSESDINLIARKYGATFNAFTSRDKTSYYFETNKNNWQPFVGILSDVMQNSRFDKQHLNSELKAVIQELKMLKDKYWRKMLDKANELLYPPNHPYHFPIIGFKENLLNLTASKLKEFYKKYYQPNNATLFVVGDFEFDEAINLIKQNFEQIPSTQPKVQKSFPSFPTELVTHDTKFFEDVNQEQLGFFWRIPGLKDQTVTVQTEAVASLLGDGEGSRLWKALVENKKIASSVAAFPVQSGESGTFMIIVTPLPKCSEKCKILVSKELTKVIEKGFSQKEFNKKIRARMRGFFETLQDCQSFTYEWIESFFATNNEFDIFTKIKQFENLKMEDLQNFVKIYINPNLINKIQVLPLDENQKRLTQDKQKEADELDQKILGKHPRTSELEEPRFANQMPEPSKFEFTFPKPEADFKLSNGLKVLLLTNKKSPLISMSCQFKEAQYFASSKEGILVDFMMTMLMEGCDEYTKTDNVEFFENFGANYSFDSSGGSLALINADSKPLFERFIYILTHPKFEDEAIIKIKEIIINSMQRRKDQPWDVASKILKQAVYGKHPFSWNYDEAIKMVREVNRTTLEELHKKYVTPANMILTVVGSFDIPEMQKQLETIFGAWRGAGYKKIEYPQSSFDAGQKIDKFMLRDQAVLIFGQPSPLNIYHPDIVPLKIMNYICFDSLGSRLYELREQTGIFYTATGGFASRATREHGFDYVAAMLSVDMLEKGEELIKNMVTQIAKQGVTQDEINAAKQMYLKDLIDLVSSNNSVAGTFGALESLELGFDYYDKVLQRVQTLKVDELNKISAQYFNTDKMARIRVGRVGQK